MSLSFVMFLGSSIPLGWGLRLGRGFLGLGAAVAAAMKVIARAADSTAVKILVGLNISGLLDSGFALSV
jgi:hypothetical protein